MQANYTLKDKQLSRTMEVGSELLLGPIADISEVSIQSYGKVWGAAAQVYQVDLEEIKKRPKEDVTVEINATYTGWTFTPQWVGPHPKAELPQTGDPWDAFPAVRARRAAGLVVLPRHVFGLPENPTQESFRTAYKEISLKWHPNKHPKNTELANEVTKIIQSARTILDAYYESLAMVKGLEDKVSEVQQIFTEKENKMPASGRYSPDVVGRDIVGVRNTIDAVKQDIGKYEAFTKTIESGGKQFEVFDDTRTENYLQSIDPKIKQEIEKAEKFIDGMIQWFKNL